MKIRLLFTALMVFSTCSIGAQNNDESIARQMGQTARTVHDSALDAKQYVTTQGQSVSDWVVNQASYAGEQMSGVARKFKNQFDLFFYDIRQGYESSQRRWHGENGE